MSTSFQNIRVLIVEPSSVQARIIADELHEIGVMNVSRVDTGKLALEALTQDSPELVVSAFYLPDMSGTELIQAVRADEQWSGVAFVLISSETRPEVLDAVRQAGSCAILPKPFSKAQLATAVRSAVDFLNPGASLEVGNVDLETLRVLIVDDSANARKFIKRILGNLGIENFYEAENGREAANLLSTTLVDIVFTDYNMPEMDGQALVEHIRKHSWQSDVPVLMITSETNEGRLAAVEQAGVSAICDKPFEPRTVKALIESVLTR